MRNTGSREGLTMDKVDAWLSLIAGDRPNQFTSFREKTPTIEEFLKIEEEEETEIDGVVFDLDGTLISQYSPITPEVIELLEGYVRVKGRGKVAIYTNSSYSKRLDIFEEIGVKVIDTNKKKPSRGGFLDACDQIGTTPDKTAMIGNFAATDMALTKKGEEKLFPINILVKTIAPSADTIEAGKSLTRAKVLNILNIVAEKITLFRNPDLLEES